MVKEIVVVGSGLAGSMVAHFLQETCHVTVICKGGKANSNSMLAQGGIAVALREDDTFQSHLKNTLEAGSFYNDRKNTALLVKTGPKVIKELISQGLTFDQDETGHLAYGLEGAHDIPRILHAKGDQTGQVVTEFSQSRLDKVDWIEHAQVIDLLVNELGQCTGVTYLDQRNQLQQINGDKIILATGGVGGLFPLSSNDLTVTGVGIALAKRNQVEVKDLEFVQFHPTLLTKNGKCYGLVSEAVRGAGAVLVDETGRLIMKDRHVRQDLAPRDVISRILSQELEQGHDIYLDISKVENFEKKFPQITANLFKQGIPFQTTNKIPVRPGAHFIMGGILTDSYGQTSMPNLYAVGEVACTGVHGANRLASNSLLECLVFATRVSEHILQASQSVTIAKNERPVKKQPEKFHLPNKELLQHRAWQAIGIERKRTDLIDFLHWLSGYHYTYIPTDLTKQEAELADLCCVAEEIARAALARPISIGAHFIKGE